MVIYADILVILNLLVDYFLLLAVAKILRKNPSVWRILAGAAIGAAASLSLFLPERPVFINTAFQIVLCAVMVLCVFGFHGIKPFLRAGGVLVLVTCGYAGLMTALWQMVRPNGMAVRNGVVYFDISPGVLLACSVGAYVAFMVVSTIFRRTYPLAESCTVTVSAEENSVTLSGLIDTGNSLEDVFSGGEVIIADHSCIRSLFGDRAATDEAMQTRYRLIPCGTVAGGGALEGYRCDRAVVSDGKKTVTLEKPILALSKTPLKDEYEAIVNPRVFL